MDILDHAKELEQRQIDEALKAHRAGVITEQPDETNGIRYCLGCGIEIEPERIAAAPTAARCVSCKTLMERNRNG